MRTKLLTRIAALAVVGSLLPVSLAAQDAASKSAPASTAKPQAVKFRPAVGGAPSVRVTGGSRGAGDATITLDVLAPDATGLTTQEQPSLFWYQSKPAK